MAEAEVPTPTFYEKTYKDLKARRDALLRQVAGMDPVLEGLERLMRTSPAAARHPKKRRRSRSSGTHAKPSNREVREGQQGQPQGQQPGQYSKMELIDAAVNCLTIAGPQTNKNLADMLLAGGVQTKAKDFPATIFATLKRDRAVKLGIRKENGKWVIRK
jgi:hypothetical protein